jgi:adenylate kinase family enzyme
LALDVARNRRALPRPSATVSRWADHPVLVVRVVVLGRGGSGKSTAAARLGQATGLPVIELDALFWQSNLSPTPTADWVRRQQELVSANRWILDGDLGRYDAPSVRLARADTVLILDFSLLRCTWRAVRRSRERADFWCWLITWRHRSRPALQRAITTHAPHATVHIVRNPRQLRRLLATIEHQHHECGDRPQEP